MITPDEIRRTYQEIQNQIVETPMEYSPQLSKVTGARVFLKMEHLQNTGSFKLRGVLAKINSVAEDDFKKIFVAASTGNHAAAFVHVSQERGFKSVLYLPEKVSPAKVKAIEHYDTEIRYFGNTSMETEMKAIAYAKEIGGILIHPYNDREIVKGQGTIGIEIEAQCPEVDTIIAPIGGGGLISGICCYFNEHEKIEVVGCQPENASEMYDSLKIGHAVPSSTLATISDATAGGIEKGSITIDICDQYLSTIELCSEEQIKQAVALIVTHHQTIIEPASALGLAALMNTDRYKGKNVVLVLTGKKINTALLTQILSDYGSNN